MRRRLPSVLFAIAVSLALPPEARAQAAHDYRVVLPAGSGPHPVAVLLPGCTGFAFSTGYDEASKRLERLGYASVFVDPIGRRTASGNCVSAQIPMSAAAADLAQALEWLEGQPFVDPGRVVVIGWSFGGGSLIDALSRASAAARTISRAVAFYPQCRWLAPPASSIPLLVIQAGADDVVRNEVCTTLLDASTRAGSTRWLTLPDALHAFDMTDLPPRRTYALGTIGHDPQAARAAWQRVVEFLSGKE